MFRNTKYLASKSMAIGPMNIKNRAPDNRPSDMSNSLIAQLRKAVKEKFINELLTVKKVESWMTEHDIRQENGTRYKKGYAANLLYNSLIKEKKTKNRNSKWLHRRKNENGHYEYWFAELFPGHYSPE